MTFRFTFFIILIILCSVRAGFFSKKKVMIKDLRIDNCGTTPQLDPVQLRDVEVSTTDDGDLVVSGTMINKMVLSPPIKASVSMQRKVLGVWIHVFCISDFGSCDFEDVCSYGLPEEEDCPPLFEEHDVPCHCPIETGNYSLPGGQFQVAGTRWAGIMAGKYRGTINFFKNEENIGCYSATFALG